jgi:hypothetical protein
MKSASYEEIEIFFSENIGENDQNQSEKIFHLKIAKHGHDIIQRIINFEDEEQMD